MEQLLTSENIKRVFTVDLAEPATKIGIFEIESDVALEDIKKLVEKGRNCQLAIEGNNAFIVCGSKR